MTKYTCKKEFSLYVFDENEEIDDTQVFNVAEGSVWSETEEEIGEVRLERVADNTHQWMEISKETLKNHFEEYAHKVR